LKGDLADRSASDQVSSPNGRDSLYNDLGRLIPPRQFHLLITARLATTFGWFTEQSARSACFRWNLWPLFWMSS